MSTPAVGVPFPGANTNARDLGGPQQLRRDADAPAIDRPTSVLFDGAAKKASPATLTFDIRATSVGGAAVSGSSQFQSVSVSLPLGKNGAAITAGTYQGTIEGTITNAAGRRSPIQATINGQFVEIKGPGFGSGNFKLTPSVRIAGEDRTNTLSNTGSSVVNENFRLTGTWKPGADTTVTASAGVTFFQGSNSAGVSQGEVRATGTAGVTQTVARFGKDGSVDVNINGQYNAGQTATGLNYTNVNIGAGVSAKAGDFRGGVNVNYGETGNTSTNIGNSSNVPGLSVTVNLGVTFK